jgi:hypothetical protein
MIDRQPVVNEDATSSIAGNVDARIHRFCWRPTSQMAGSISRCVIAIGMFLARSARSALDAAPTTSSIFAERRITTRGLSHSKNWFSLPPRILLSSPSSEEPPSAEAPTGSLFPDGQFAPAGSSRRRSFGGSTR